MFNRLKKVLHRDYVVCYSNLDCFYKLWNITLKQREYAPKFYIHSDGTVWVSYMRAEVSYNGSAIIPHAGYSGVYVYDTKRFILECENVSNSVPHVISNINVSGHFSIPKPVLYSTCCGMLSRVKFLDALELKVNLKRVHHELR